MSVLRSRTATSLACIGMALWSIACTSSAPELDAQGASAMQSSGPAVTSSGAPHGVQSKAEREHVYVVFRGPSAVEVWSASQRGLRARHNAEDRVRDLIVEHRAVMPKLRAAGAAVVADYQRLLNAVQVFATAEEIEQIKKLPEVLRIDPVTRVERSNVVAAPHIGASQAWGRSLPVDGEGDRRRHSGLGCRLHARAFRRERREERL